MPLCNAGLFFWQTSLLLYLTWLVHSILTCEDALKSCLGPRVIGCSCIYHTVLEQCTYSQQGASGKWAFGRRFKVLQYSMISQAIHRAFSSVVVASNLSIFSAREDRRDLAQTACSKILYIYGTFLCIPRPESPQLFLFIHFLRV